MFHLLVIDDEVALCEAIRHHFSRRNWTVHVAHRGKDAAQICLQENIDIVLLDQRLPDMAGIDLCPTIMSCNDKTKIIFITAYPNVDHAIEAIRKGAYDYLTKPFKMEFLELAIQRAYETIKLEKIGQIQQYNEQKECEQNRFIGLQGGLKEIRTLVELAAQNEAPVLITGETGTGKSMIARRIHCRGARKEDVFITSNCAAFPDNLIEAELFGYEKGAFTGATSARKGIFEMAEGGTLFLDEMGEIPIHLQPKLLGVLDDSRIRRLGSEKVRRVDSRIIAATNKNLEEAIAANQFRKDLYFRLGVIRIHIPPLRERREDVADLSEYFLQLFDTSGELDFAPGEIEKLMQYDWPGNVRELKNVVERSLILRKGDRIEPSKLLMDGISPAGQSHEVCPNLFNEDFAGVASEKDLPPLKVIEDKYIRHVLRRMDNNYSAAARVLQISRSTLLRKVKPAPKRFL